MAATGRAPGNEIVPPPDQGAKRPSDLSLPELRRRLAQHADTIIETLIVQASEGEPTALRLAVERMWPSQGAPAASAPEGTLLAQAQQVIQAFENSRLTRTQAETMLRSLLVDPDAR